MRVILKYCGACNPQVQLGSVGRQIRALLLGSGVTIVPAAEAPADLVVIVNGCATACTDRPDVRALAIETIVVAGESVDMQPVPEDQLAQLVVEVILRRR